MCVCETERERKEEGWAGLRGWGWLLTAELCGKCVFAATVKSARSVHEAPPGKVLLLAVDEERAVGHEVAEIRCVAARARARAERDGPVLRRRC